MPSKYEPKYNPDGSLNDAYKPRNPKWKKQPSGKRGKNSKSGHSKNLYERAHFIAWDGEGGDYNGTHVYNLFAYSNGGGDGQAIYDEAGLSTREIFEYICDTCAEQKPGAVNVIYGGSYDANMWLKDIDRETLEELKAADGRIYIQWDRYHIRYMPRKYFAVKRVTDEKPCVIWDVIGFFQGSFISALKNWLPNDSRTELIIKGKSQRSQFTAADLNFIMEYCQAELDCLVLIMGKLLDAINDLGLTLRRWDGAGAVAVAMMKKYDAKRFFVPLPDDVLVASEHAYFGGRIEIGKYGRHVGNIHHYDINSAYPAAQTLLPALSAGRWINRGADYDCRQSPNSMIISLVQWDFIDDTPFCPFAYRSWEENKVLFPPCGLNWIWKPELAAALDVKEKQNRARWSIQINDCWEFIPDDPSFRPFEWIEENFEERKRIVAESKRTGIPNGMEKVIKLGLNSLYGKTAQKAGYDEKSKRKPPFHNIAYAGYITSATRAKLWAAAMQAPDQIIALATDGIYSRVPLTLDCPKEKILGLWEEQTHDEMVLVQAGFYWIRDGEKLVSYSRGFDKMTTAEEMQETLDNVLAAWKAKKYELRLPCTRFITLNTALISDKWFARWRTWHEMENDEGVKGRRLALSPVGTKRMTKSMNYGAPHKTMVDTLPVTNISELISEKYSLPWDDDNATDPSDVLINIEHAESLC